MKTEAKGLVNDFSPDTQIKFIGVDFETLTPAGRSPEPIEIGSLMLNSDLSINKSFRFQRFIKPPKGVYFTQFDINQTGITQTDVDKSPCAVEILTEYNILLSRSTTIFIAQNARYDYGILKRYGDYVENIVSRPFLDTIKLAKHLFPNLSNYRLDTLADFTSVKLPLGRHRAIVDVQVTLDVFRSLIKTAVEKDICKLSDIIRISDITDWYAPKQLEMF